MSREHNKLVRSGINLHLFIYSYSSPTRPPIFSTSRLWRQLQVTVTYTLRRTRWRRERSEFIPSEQAMSFPADCHSRCTRKQEIFLWNVPLNDHTQHAVRSDHAERLMEQPGYPRISQYQSLFSQWPPISSASCVHPWP